MKSVNPAPGEVLASFDELTDAQIEERLARAVQAFAAQRRSSFAERGKAMRKAGDILEREKVRFGTMMTREMGKTLRSAVAEAEKCAWVCRYYADEAETYLAAPTGCTCKAGLKGTRCYHQLAARMLLAA